MALETLSRALFADLQSVKTSATCYSLIETTRASHLAAITYIHHVLEHIAITVTLEKLETLHLPQNTKL